MLHMKYFKSRVRLLFLISALTKRPSRDVAMPSREQDIYFAKLAEQAERYDEMAEYMQRVGEQPAELSVEERNLLSVAYKNAVGSRRAAWRIITSVEQKEKTKGNEQQASYAREYVAKVEAELQKICDGILALMDKNLIPSASTGESKVFYYKMKGDYYRYLAEFATGDAKSKAAEDAPRRVCRSHEGRRERFGRDPPHPPGPRTELLRVPV